MKTYRVYINGNKTDSRVLASNRIEAYEKAKRLNERHGLYDGFLTVQKEGAL